MNVKRLLSILVIFTMLSASALMIVPISAEETDNDVIIESEFPEELEAREAMASYKPNWNELVENGLMRAQWQNDDSDEKNDYGEHFEVNATENSISSVALENAEERAYYSTADIYRISEGTRYEYTFEAKNNSSEPSGVIFAYDRNTKTPYYLYGFFQNASESEGVDISYGMPTGAEQEPAEQEPDKAYIVKENDGFGKFKLVFTGFSVQLYYLNLEDKFLSLGEPCVLAEGATVCLGVYSRENNGTLELKNAELAVFNNESFAALKGYSESKIALAAALDAAESIAIEEYTDDTASAFKSAFNTGKNAYSDLNKTDAELDEAALALNKAIGALKTLKQAELEKMKTVFLIALSAKRENTDKVFTDASYAEYSAAYDAIVAEINNIEDLDTLYLFDIAALKVAAERLLVINIPDLDAEEDEDYVELPEIEDEEDVVADDDTLDEDTSRGCFSSISLSAIAIAALIGSAFLVKKH